MTAASRRHTPLFKRGTEIEDVAWHPMRARSTPSSAMSSRRFAHAHWRSRWSGRWRWPRKLKPLEARVEEILSRNGKRVAIN